MRAGWGAGEMLARDKNSHVSDWSVLEKWLWKAEDGAVGGT